MPDQSDSIRFRADGLGQRFADAVKRTGPEADMSKVLRAFVRWYVGEPGAQLPQRPGAVAPPATAPAASKPHPYPRGAVVLALPAAKPEPTLADADAVVRSMPDGPFMALRNRAIGECGSNSPEICNPVMREIVLADMIAEAAR